MEAAVAVLRRAMRVGGVSVQELEGNSNLRPSECVWALTTGD